jgi:DNA-binding response OmpR family regulator
MSNSQGTLLIVEDEEAIGEGLKFNFEAEGFVVHWARDGAEGIRAITTLYRELDCVLLDLMLPEVDGFEVLRRTREIAEQIPILVLSAKGLETDKVRALELGADDYVTKPFSLLELLLRVRGLTKRRRWYRDEEHGDEIRIGRGRMNPRTLLVSMPDGSTSRASPTELQLAMVFLENPNKVLTRAELLERVWNYDSKMETRTVDVFVGKLRRFMELNPSRPDFLISVRGVGYAYVTDPALKEQLLTTR